MIGTFAGVFSALLGVICAIIGFSESGTNAFLYYGSAVSCVLFGALLWEIGSCSISLAAIAKKMDAQKSTDKTKESDKN